MNLLLNICYVMGLIPYYNKKYSEFQPSKLKCYIIGLLIFICQIVMIYLSLDTYLEENTIQLIIYKLNMIFPCLLILIMMLNYVSKRFKSFVLVFDCLKSSEKLFEDHFKVSVKKISCVEFLGIELVAILLTFYKSYILIRNLDSFKIEMVIIMLFEHIKLFYSDFAVYLQLYILRSIKQQFVHFNHVFRELNNDDNQAMEQLKNLSSIHEKLCDAVKYFNNFFQWIILLNILVVFMDMLIFIDGGINESTNLKFYEMIALIICLIISIYRGVALGYAGEDLREKLNESKAIVFRSVAIYANDDKVKDSLMLLLHQFEMREVRITAAGFFSIDFAMIFMFINLVVTYTIVILQFYTANEDKHGLASFGGSGGSTNETVMDYLTTIST